MDDFKVCAGCLNTGVKMFNLYSSGLQLYYETTGILLCDYMPNKLCWECAALVNKFNMFRLKCERAHTLLHDCYMMHGEIKIDDVKSIDKNEIGLSSSLCHKKSEMFQYKPEQITDMNEITIENVNIPQLKLDYDDGNDIKSEPLSPDNGDDDFYHVDDDDIKNNATGEREIVNNDNKEVNSKMKLKEKINKHNGMEKKTKNNVKFIEESLTHKEAKKLFLSQAKSTKYKNAKHPCNICFKNFKTSEVLNNHMRRHDSTKDYECDICRLRFKKESLLKIHHKGQHSKKYSCVICSSVFFTKDKAISHSSKHSKAENKIKKQKNPLKVSAYEFGFDEILLTQEQMVASINERQFLEAYTNARYKCTLCYKQFNEDKPYENHKQLHDTVSGPYICDICKFRYKTRQKLYKHITNNHKYKYNCKKCNHQCYNRGSAQRHHLWHSGVTYTCHVCGNTSNKMSTHLSHVRIKHPSGHICADCGRSYVSRMGLHHHVTKMHEAKPNSQANSDGPYCGDCDIKFTSRQAWTKHILLSEKHDKEKKEVMNGCHICGETFESPSDLKKHHKADHKRKKALVVKKTDKQFNGKCSQCDKLMTSSASYIEHFRTRHPDIPLPLAKPTFICEYCGNVFKHKSTLDQHTLTHNRQQ